MSLAAKHFDPVLGVDIHLIQPPGPVPPIPIPHPFVGFLFDPFDYVPIIGSTIKVNGFHRAIAGTMGRTIPGLHFPLGGTFIKPPANECEMFMGSRTVQFDGEAASYMALPSLSCQDIGMMAPLRLNPKKKSKIKSLVLPTSVVLPIPPANPVIIGGEPTISLTGLAMKLGMLALAKGLRRLASMPKLARGLQRLKRKAFAWMKPGFIKCVILKAEPVNLVTGEVVVEQQDFELPGRIPLKWTRYYNSGNPRLGACGVGWETPADARLVFEEDGGVRFHDGLPGAAVFESLPLAGPVLELVGGARLRAEAGHFVVRVSEGLEYWFPKRRSPGGEALVESIRDLCGNAIAFSRDPEGSLLGLMDSAGRSLPVVSSGGLIESIWVDKGGGAGAPLAAYRYSERREMVGVYDALQKPYHFEYRNRLLVRHTDRRGLSFYYEYDAQARCVHAWGDGRLYDYRFRYYETANLTEVEDSRGNRSLYLYDENRFVVQEWDPLGHLTEYEYDDAGRTSAVVDPLERRTEYLYGESGNLLELKQPDGTAFRWDYDGDNRVTAFTDGQGAQWRNEWESRGLLRQRISPLGAQSSYEYNERGDLVASVDALGHAVRLDLKADGSLRSITDPKGGVTKLEVDELGNTRTSTDPAGFTTSYTYDEKFRLTSVRSPGGREEQFWWDSEDDLAAYRDPAGYLTRFEYRGLGEIARKTAPDGGQVSYEYDTEENLVAVVNERQQRYRLEYDVLNRVAREVDYWGRETVYRYDAAGQVAESVNGAGRKLAFEFSPAGRMIERRESSDRESRDRFDRYRYDGNGNLIQAENQHIRLRRKYDLENRLVEEVMGDFRVANQYDALGQRVARQSSNGSPVTYEYDECGWMSAVAVQGVGVSRMVRDARHLPVQEALSGELQRGFRWDADGYLEAQQVRTAKTVVGEQQFRYDQNGNQVGRLDSRRGQSVLGYDPTGRLSHYVSPMASVIHRVEALEAGPVEAGGGLSWKSENASYEFDAAGNLAIRRDSQGETRFEWDANNRLVAAHTPAGDHAQYTYDPLGRRIAKEVNGKKTRFCWDGDVLLSETASIQPTREYVYYPETFTPLAMSVNGHMLHYHNDPVGLPHDLYTGQGDLVWSARYGPFGDANKITDEVDNPLRLQGQYYDAETGLHYNRFRYFDPAIGRFISTDPLGLAAGPDLYEYAPNVWNWVDPLGLSYKKWSIKGRIKAAGLPTKGKIRYVPPVNYKPSMPLPKGLHGYIDKFENEWVKGPSRTAGQHLEWDVQLSRVGKEQLGWASRDKAHLNVSLDGRITHR